MTRRRTHPRRRAVHRRDPSRLRRRDPRQAHHPAGQACRRRPGVRDDRQRRRRIKLAGRTGAFDVVDEFGVEADRAAALDVVTQLAVGAGFDALRDAGIPLVLHYKTTSIGTQLPDRWMLPDALRDDTGIVFASRVPRARRVRRRAGPLLRRQGRRDQLAAFEEVRGALSGATDAAAASSTGGSTSCARSIEREPYAVRPQLPVPRPRDGPLAVRGDHRCARPEHARECRVRRDDPSDRPGRGLGPHRALPPRHRRRCRRRHARPSHGLDGRGLPLHRRGGDRRAGRGRGAALRPPPARDDPRDGRGRVRRRVRRRRPRTGNRADLRGARRRSPRTARSTARVST